MWCLDVLCVFACRTHGGILVDVLVIGADATRQHDVINLTSHLTDAFCYSPMSRMILTRNNDIFPINSMTH
jgi:hypothetical protein